MQTAEIDYPEIVARAEWLAARERLLKEEKEFTRARDRLNATRRRLPMVEMDADYAFEGPDGRLSLRALFGDRLQLVVYHFMWLWDEGEPREAPCHSCSSWADEIGRGYLANLRLRGAELALVSRAPYPKIGAFKKRMGWSLPWYSSHGSAFNYDFGVTLDASVAPLAYNYRSREEHEKAGTGYYFGGDQPFDLPGFSCFLRRGDTVYQTYSTYGRGCEAIGGSNCMLDLTALGRQEDWEEPKGRATGLGVKAGSDKIAYPDERDACCSG